MSNLPLGADNDPYAPYNIKEATLNFDIAIKGTAWYEYYDEIDLDIAIGCIASSLKKALEGIGDIEIDNIDISLS